MPYPAISRSRRRRGLALMALGFAALLTGCTAGPDGGGTAAAKDGTTKTGDAGTEAPPVRFFAPLGY